MKATYRAVPVPTYLGSRGFGLKGPGKRFEPIRKPLGVLGKQRVPGFGCLAATLDQLVGKKKRREQQLARLGKRAEAGKRLTALGVNQSARLAQIFFLAVAAGDPVGAAGDRDINLGHSSSLRHPDDLVELGNRFADSRPKLFVPSRVLPLPLQCTFNPRQRPLCTVEGSRESAIVHGRSLSKSVVAGKR